VSGGAGVGLVSRYRPDKSCELSSDGGDDFVGVFVPGEHPCPAVVQALLTAQAWDGKLVKSYPTDDNGTREDIIFNNGYGDPALFKAGAEGAIKIDYVRAWE